MTKRRKNSLTDNIWVKVASTIVVLVVSGVGAVVLERMGSLQTELGSLGESVDRVKELDGIKERVIRLEVTAGQNTITDHAQLSSAVSQFPDIDGIPIELELVDSISGIEFDPRRSRTKIRITSRGEYLYLIAPQVQRVEGFTDPACVDVWLRINGKDLANSSVRQCWSADTDWEATSVLILQATLPMRENDVVEIMTRSTPAHKAGAVAISTGDIPLIPSVIVAILKVG